MKKKYRFPIIAIGILFLLLAASAVIMSARGIGISVGRYVEAQSGASLIVVDDSAIRMSDTNDKDLFDGLGTGDKILIFHGSVAQSYPGKTNVSALLRLSRGSKEDIPEAAVDKLTEMGWLAAE